MKFLVAITALLVVVMGALLFVVNSDGGSNSANVHEGAPPVDEQPTYGDENATVSVIEFGDYKCPACGTWDRDIFPELQADYLDSGDVSYSYVNYLGFREESLVSSLASHKVHNDASDEEFWDFHHELMQTAGVQGSTIGIDEVLAIAEGTAPSVDQDELRESIEQQEYMSEIEREHEMIEEFDVTGTPTIFINDVEVSDPFDYDAISEIIDEQLENAS